MAELAIRRGNGGPLRRSQGALDPLRALREMMNWDPFGEVVPISGHQLTQAFTPSFDVLEMPNAFIFKADLPGMSEKDVDVTNAGNVLTITGSRRDEREDKGDTYYVCERSYGRFTRSFTLPQGADGDHVSAAMKDGVLTVTVPRLASVHVKKIPVKAAVTAKA